jgi:hypothetical protein
MKTKKNINYRNKNRKNKKKYSLRKNTKHGGHKTYKNPNIVRPNFEVIPNNGVPRERGTRMSNQCLWISIVDFLNREGIADIQTGEQITVSGIRSLLSQQNYVINNENQMADTQQLYDSLLNLSQLYNLRFEFFDISNEEGVYRRENGEIINNNYFVIDNSVEGNHDTNVVPIAFYGHHFQLITSGTDSDNNPIRYGNGNQTSLQLDEQNTKMDIPKPEKLFLNKRIKFIEDENEDLLKLLEDKKDNKSREQIVNRIQNNYDLIDEEIKKEKEKELEMDKKLKEEIKKEKELELEMDKKLKEKILLEDKKNEIIKKINNFGNKDYLDKKEESLLYELINENEAISKNIDNVEIEITRLINKLDELKKYGGNKKKINKQTKKRNIRYHK